MQVKKQQLESYLEQLVGLKLPRGYDTAVYYYLIYLTCMQSTSCEILGWLNLKLELRLLGEISTISDMQMTKQPLQESERGEWKNWLKTQHT